MNDSSSKNDACETAEFGCISYLMELIGNQIGTPYLLFIYNHCKDQYTMLDLSLQADELIQTCNDVGVGLNLSVDTF